MNNNSLRTFAGVVAAALIALASVPNITRAQDPIKVGGGFALGRAAHRAAEDEHLRADAGGDEPAHLIDTVHAITKIIIGHDRANIDRIAVHEGQGFSGVQGGYRVPTPILKQDSQRGAHVRIVFEHDRRPDRHPPSLKHCAHHYPELDGKNKGATTPFRLGR